MGVSRQVVFSSLAGVLESLSTASLVPFVSVRVPRSAESFKFVAASALGGENWESGCTQI